MIDVRYSVYSAKDDLPLIICGTVPQCAKAIGVTVGTFRSMASRQKHGKADSGIGKYRIVRENVEAET